jgi:hypothetical protein
MDYEPDTNLVKTVFDLPLDGGRCSVRFHTPRQLTPEEWDRVYRWLDLIKGELTQSATLPPAEEGNDDERR